MNDNITGIVYGYFLREHLGNPALAGQVVRMVLTEDNKSDPHPAVTFEAANLTHEQIYYDNVGAERTLRHHPAIYWSHLLESHSAFLADNQTL